MPDEPEETEEELEQRLRKLLGEADSADPDEIDEIELKLRDIDAKLEAQRTSRTKSESDFDTDFENRLTHIEQRAKRGGKAPGSDSRPLSSRGPISGGSGVGLAFAVGYSFVGPVLSGIVIGLWLDHWRSGLWTIVGLAVGTSAAFYLLIRLVIRLNDAQK